MSMDAALLETLTGTSGRLADGYGKLAEAAHAAGDHKTGLGWFDAFDRAFFAFRVGLNLKVRLIREARAPARQPGGERPEAERPEPLETERPEALERLEYTERDRDRDTERASFPLLLKTLNGLVADADTLPGPPPAELLDLKALLATVGAPPKTQATALRARLTGSTAGPVTTLDRPKPISGLRLPPRRATGPP